MALLVVWNTTKNEPFKKNENTGFGGTLQNYGTRQGFEGLSAIYFCCGGNGSLDDSPPSRQTRL